MLYRISVTERGLTGIANIFRSRLSRLDDLLGAGTVPLMEETLKIYCFLCPKWWGLAPWVRPCAGVCVSLYFASEGHQHVYFC